MTRKTLRRDAAIERLEAKKTSKSRTRKNTQSSPVDQQHVGEDGVQQNSPDYSKNSPELSPVKLILEKSMRAESFDSPALSSSSTNGWFLSRMSMFGDWILVEEEMNTEDEDSSYVVFRKVGKATRNFVHKTHKKIQVREKKKC